MLTLLPVLSVSSPFKAPSSAPVKRARESDITSDSENVDPVVFNSPSKRVKNFEGTPVKVKPKFTLTDSTIWSEPARKTTGLSLSVPPTTTSTPISHSRGSPKLKHRMSLLGSKRRTSSALYRRINPSSTTASPLPFSIDAALSGTVSTPGPSTAAADIVNASISELLEPIAPRSTASSKPIPNNWFFEIHEDTPDQEAANLMEHSASVLDISSDDDSITARAKDALERGKENIPPPEYTGPTRRSRDAAGPAAHKGIKCAKKAAKYAAAMAVGVDDILEDRKALQEMDATVFWDDDSEETATDAAAENRAEQPALVTEPVYTALLVPAPADPTIVIHEDDNARDSIA
jgi:hypothetical protein